MENIKKHRNRITQWEVRIVPPEMYPDLKINPTNHWTDMPDEERLKYFIQTMGRVWAETVQDNLRQQKRSESSERDRPPTD